MKLSENCASLLPILSLLVSFVSAILTNRNTNKQIEQIKVQIELLKEQHKSDQATLELDLAGMISSASKHLHEIAIAISDDLSNDIKTKAFEAAAEEYRNAYETACEKCTNGKVDEKWFEKTYGKDIKHLVEDESPFYADDSPYQNTIKVYNKLYKSSVI